jgi:integrase
MAHRSTPGGQTKPPKPYPEFPLFPHATKRWAKKIRGRLHYFGPWHDPQGALRRYLDEKDALYAGRTPGPRSEGGPTVRDLLNRFLAAKQTLVESGELTPRSFADYKSTCDGIRDEFGLDCRVLALGAENFEKFRARIAKRCGPVRLGTEIQRIRSVFKYAFDAGLIERPVRFGPTFKKPPRRVLRKHRATNGERMFESAELRTIIDAAKMPLKAMIVSGVNCAFGNHDVGGLPSASLDLDGGWVRFPRPKTGIDRRCPLWPETIEAIREWLAKRPEPKDPEHAGLVFVTKKKGSWAKEATGSHDSPLSREFATLLKAVGLYKHGRGFYNLRHVFETIGGESRDQVAVDYIMGHSREDMASVYRERISDERLRGVVEHVRTWLLGKEKTQ